MFAGALRFVFCREMAGLCTLEETPSFKKYGAGCFTGNNMSHSLDKLEQDRHSLHQLKSQGSLTKVLGYSRLSAPGWLQGAITLGGGSLGGSLYLGVIGGYQLMWLQPLMMILGIVMLSAIGYVTLSTGERPFQAINRHVNPVLGWGWAIATLTATMILRVASKILIPRPPLS